MARRMKSRRTSEQVDARSLREIDLRGRPFLHEQGNVVTRGFVDFLELEEEHWVLHVRDVELLDKRAFAWVRDADADAYGGALARTSVTRWFRGLTPVFDDGIQIDCYGLLVHVGRASDDPFGDNDWPELDSEVFAAVGM